MGTRYDRRIAARASSIDGTGRFTTAPFAGGETVAELGGLPLTSAEFRLRIAGLEKYNAIQIDEDRHLFDDSPDFAQGFINHSCDSNLVMGGATTVVTRRAIAAGEELTLDYALFTTDPAWSLSPCRCGSTACRGTVTGEDWRLPEVQGRYAGRFSPFINARIAALSLR